MAKGGDHADGGLKAALIPEAPEMTVEQMGDEGYWPEESQPEA